MKVKVLTLSFLAGAEKGCHLRRTATSQRSSDSRRDEKTDV